jgi:tRNA U34 5-carboxymethylaminomethyl modifying GTPase MnmE/TrmE
MTNAGKSSVMNFITNQNMSIVSEAAGTVTDVIFIDVAQLFRTCNTV